jgi:NitT/TauT family transport system permease protein
VLPLAPGAPAAAPEASVVRAHTPLAPPESPADTTDFSVPTRLLRGAVFPIRYALSPLGYVFRIREQLPTFWRLTLPCVLFVAVILFWSWGTTGDHILGAFPSLSPLEEKKLEIERALGSSVALVTTDREVKSWSSPEKKVFCDILAVTLPAAAFDAHKAEAEKLLGADQFTVEERAGGDAKLVARSHLGRFERVSEYDKALAKLKAGIPGFTVTETRAPVPASGDPQLTVLVSATAPEAAAIATDARTVLDEVVGSDGWVVTVNDGKALITGAEKLETRKISPALLPSPREMLDALPSLINGRWLGWDDAKHWWSLGHAEQKETPAPAAKPIVLDWKSPNQVPFTLAAGLFERWIGPNWADWTLLQAVTWSTLRIIMGFLYAALVAVPLGVIMGSFSKPRAFFEPVRLMGAYLPLPAFMTLTIYWWGTTESQKIGFLAICTFVVLLPQIVMAVESIPQAHIDAARTLGANRWHQMRYVLLAGTKADIMRSLRLSFAVGWTWIILAEAIDPKAGLGYVIQLGDRRPAHRPHIYAAILLIVGLAFLINTSWAWVERKLYPYRDEEVST